jgi:hypothetical protein
MVVRWVSRQWTRFDLTLTKFSKFLVVLNALSNLSVALTLAGFVLLAMMILSGTVALVLVGVVLHKAGFFTETINEAFDQQSKELYKNQIHYHGGVIAQKLKMSPEELKLDIAKYKEALKL